MHSSADRIFRRIALASAFILLVRAFAALVGFITNTTALLALVGGEPYITPLSVASYFVIAVAVWRLELGAASRLVRVCGLVVVLASVDKLFHLAVGTGGPLVFHREHMFSSLPSALSLFTLGIALLAVDWPAPSVRRLLHVLLGITFAVALTTLIGYMYGFRELTTFGFAGPYRVENSVLVVLASLALLCARRYEVIFSLIASKTSAGRMSRALLPAVFLLPFLGLLTGAVHQTRTALLLLLNLFLYGLPVLVLAIGWQLQQVENDREQAYSELNDVNARLKDKVASLELTEKRLREALGARDQLIANVSHELRTPLHTILGITQLLSAKPLRKEEQEWLSLVKQAGEKLLDLITQILTFSDVEADRLKVRLSDFSPVVSVQHCVESARQFIENKDLRLNVAVTGDIPATIRTDRSLFESILRSLLDNAIRFTKVGSITVSLSIVKKAEKAMLFLSIQDTGSGMSEKVVQQLPQPFQQGDSSFNRQHGGLGLGMALAYRIVALLGGEISVISAEGVGTTVKVFLPVGTGSMSVQKPALGINTGPQRILIVEDNQVNARVLQLHINKLGVAADVVTDGQAAIAAVATGKYGLVLMDVQMPVMDGLEATRRIRSAGGANSAIPIVAVTAHAGESDRRKCFEAGMNDFVTKPVSPSALQQVLTRWLHVAGHDIA